MYSFLSTSRNQVLKEIDPRIGYLELDLSNDHHYDFFIEKVGSLEKFEAENPELKNMVSRLRSERLVRAPFFTEEGLHEGPDDLMAIENLMVRKKPMRSGVDSVEDDIEGMGLAQIKANYVNKKKRIKVVTEFYDATLGVLLNTLEEYVDDTDQYQGLIIADYAKLVKKEAREFLLTSLFVCSENRLNSGANDLQLKAYVTKEESFVINGNSNMIKSFTLNDPVMKAGHTGEEVRVSYLREGVIPDYDYSYPFDPFKNKEHTKITVRMPFSVTVETKESFWIDGIAENYGYDLWLTNMTTGQVRSYAMIPEIIQRKDAFNADNQCIKMTFIFPDEWHNMLDFSKLGYTPFTKIDLYGAFKVLISDEDSTLPIGVSVKSSGDTYDDLNIPCKKIWIQWGCVAKDTKLTMADGTLKEAQFVTMEDSLMDYQGRACQITNIYSGPQDEIQEIKTDSGKHLKITKDHTIFSEKGLIPATELSVGMKIRTKDGLETVVQCEEVEYQDTVYNFKFDKTTVLIGNGIFIGDYILQNSVKELTQYED